MKLSNYQSESYQHILVFGPPKSGKSVLVGQLAKHFNLVWLDLDGGVKALADPGNLAADYAGNIEVIRIPDSKPFPVAVETVLKIFTGANCKICWDHGVVNCSACTKNPDAIWTEFCLKNLTSKDILVIDHAAQLSDSALNLITKGKGDDYKPDWDDWNKLGNILNRIFSQIQQAPFHVCVITHEMGIEQEDGKEKLMPVCGTRNYSRTFGKFFDHIVYTELLNKKHRVSSSTVANLSVLTGSRSNVALEKEPSPELWEMFKHAAGISSDSLRVEAANILKTVVPQ